MLFFFFFSSRRRHTRCSRDWSSDVCSSDLTSAPDAAPANPCTKDIRMLGYDWPRFHAAVNDLPAALLFTTVLFDVAAGLTKRASLQAAALWTLWAGVVGGGVALLAGLQAEKGNQHREAHPHL